MDRLTKYNEELRCFGYSGYLAEQNAAKKMYEEEENT